MAHPKGPMNKALFQQVRILREQGFGSRVIARRLSTNHANVSKWLRTIPRPERLVHDPIPLEEMLIEHSPHGRGNIKNRLIKAGLLTQICAICGIGPVWNDRPLMLRLDHENGINDDYRLENLRLLCPNCDSQTDTYCGRNRPR